MAVKKHKLGAIDQSDLKILGISSAESELRLCWILNQSLGTNFKLDDSIPVQTKAGLLEFVRYTCLDEEEDWKYSLIKNKNTVNVLFAELKAVDYVFVVQGDYSLNAYAGLIEKLKAIPEISAVLKVTAENLKTLKKISL